MVGKPFAGKSSLVDRLARSRPELLVVRVSALRREAIEAFRRREIKAGWIPPVPVAAAVNPLSAEQGHPQEEPSMPAVEESQPAEAPLSNRALIGQQLDSQSAPEGEQDHRTLLAKYKRTHEDTCMLIPTLSNSLSSPFNVDATVDDAAAADDDDALVVQLVVEALERQASSAGWILDDFPRNASQVGTPMTTPLFCKRPLLCHRRSSLRPALLARHVSRTSPSGK